MKPKEETKHKTNHKTKLTYNKNAYVCLLCHTKSPGSSSVLKPLTSKHFYLINLLI